MRIALYALLDLYMAGLRTDPETVGKFEAAYIAAAAEYAVEKGIDIEVVLADFDIEAIGECDEGEEALSVWQAIHDRVRHSVDILA